MTAFATAASLFLSLNDPSLEQLVALQGRWKVVALTHGEHRVEYEVGPSFTLSVAGGRMRLTEGRWVGWDLPYRLVGPGGVDLQYKRLPPRLLAYKVEGDHLTVAFAGASGVRPRVLAVGDDCDLVMELVRVERRAEGAPRRQR